MTRKPSTRRGRVESPAQLAALTSPVRQEIIDTLEGLGGEAAVADIATHLGRPADGLYYHLRELVRTGLLRELADGRDRSGRRYRTIAPPGERLSLRYTRGRSSNVKAVDRVVGSLLRTAKRDFSRALTAGTAVTEGPRRELWAARTKGWVNDADLAEINRLLVRLNELLQQTPQKDREHLMSLAFVLAPIAAQPVRRDSSVA